jgi:hypothetical protein
MSTISYLTFGGIGEATTGLMNTAFGILIKVTQFRAY